MNQHAIRRSPTGWLTGVLLSLATLLTPGWLMSATAQDDPTPEATPDPTPLPTSDSTPTTTAESTSESAGDSEDTDHRPEADARIKPRLELHAASWRTVVSEIKRSHFGVFADYGLRIATEMGGASADGFDLESVSGVVRQIADWPDSSVHLLIYAPDREGRPRWAMLTDWSLDELYRRVKPILEGEAADTLLEGVRITSRNQAGFEIALPQTTLAYLLPYETDKSCVASHADLEFPDQLFGVAANADEDEAAPTAKAMGHPAPLLTCRLNLTPTERESGATFLSSLRAVAGVDYTARVADDGNWDETIKLYWPQVVGIAAKAVVDKVKHTFFVPDEAFGAAVFSTPMVSSGLDAMAGLVVPGTFEPGPLMGHTKQDLCVTVLPGTGFLPTPDIVLQVRATRVDSLVDDVREAIEKVNGFHRQQEQPEPWHEAEVRDREVFWSDGGSAYGGGITPLSMRTVLFVTRETDAKDRDRDFLVLAQTSTSPEQLVRRWIDFPRGAERQQYLPSTKRPYGQAWVNWKQLYTWVHPWINVGLSATVRSGLLPSAESMGDDLTDAWATVKVQYSGLLVSHQGPIPSGLLAIPVLMGISMQMDESGGSDLARERLACRRLRVLYHHCALFKEDIHRWPAELAELDGYIDFAGHPELLQLQLSPKKRWSEMWGEMFAGRSEPDKQGEDEFEEEDDWGVDIDDSLFVMNWGEESWSLGIAPGTLEHLERLYIDQDGEIHRVEKEITETRSGDEAESEPAAE
ncbi:MAG: hypothetical protein IH988_00820 [Planctomycetes bacterium]|nr:hypothetical protein [Planctomycetota bacterium]